MDTSYPSPTLKEAQAHGLVNKSALKSFEGSPTTPEVSVSVNLHHDNNSSRSFQEGDSDAMFHSLDDFMNHFPANNNSLEDVKEVEILSPTLSSEPHVELDNFQYHLPATYQQDNVRFFIPTGVIASVPTSSLSNVQQKIQQVQFNNAERRHVPVSLKTKKFSEIQPCLAADIGMAEKPPYSYATIIAYALMTQPTKQMTLNELYSWCMDNFPYYKNASNGWKNAIRHNLSLNKMFVKVRRLDNDPGRGNYWTVNHEDGFLKEDGTPIMPMSPAVIVEPKKQVNELTLPVQSKAVVTDSKPKQSETTILSPMSPPLSDKKEPEPTIIKKKTKKAKKPKTTEQDTTEQQSSSQPWLASPFMEPAFMSEESVTDAARLMVPSHISLAPPSSPVFGDKSIQNDISGSRQQESESQPIITQESFTAINNKDDIEEPAKEDKILKADTKKSSVSKKSSNATTNNISKNLTAQPLSTLSAPVNFSPVSYAAAPIAYQPHEIPKTPLFPMVPFTSLMNFTGMEMDKMYVPSRLVDDVSEEKLKELMAEFLDEEMMLDDVSTSFNSNVENVAKKTGEWEYAAMYTHYKVESVEFRTYEEPTVYQDIWGLL